MIQRPKNLQIVLIDITFNDKEYRVVEIDLEHINKNGRSHFSAYEVANVVAQILESSLMWPDDRKIYGKESCTYYVTYGDVDHKHFKLVFCICSDRPSTIGVMTLHQTLRLV